MRWRYIAVFLFFIFSFIAIWLKLAYWQIVKAEELSAMGQAQYITHLEIPPKRGDIETSDEFPLVTNKLSYLLYVNPKVVKDTGKLALALSPLLNMDVASLSAKLATNKLWISLKSGIDTTTKEKIETIKVDNTSFADSGLGFQETPVRYYPEASLAAQLVGFVGKDTFGQDKGYFGLEGYYDRQLRGRVGQTTIMRDAQGNPILAKLTDNSGQKDGRTLVLHIDRSIQYLLEKKLRDGIDTYGAKDGMALVMDPKTGGILAMASFPSFDPRSYWEYDQSLYKNPIISDTYEPGSTFKPLVMSAAFDANLIKPTTICTNCAGPVKVSDYLIHTWNDKYFPNTNMIDVMEHSDNTGMVFVSQKLGLDRMLDYFHKFGIGDTTGIDIQGEFAPEIKAKEDWYPIDLATASFGQGISVTPMQLLDGFCSIANDGKRMEPHMVASIKTPDGDTIPIPPKQLDQPISSITSKVMTEILVNTVNKGEASFARLKGYRIAGKTGTASIPLNGHYDPTKTIASFEGFAPANNPKFCMLIVLNQPSASIYGAETAAPIFFDISRDILAHYGILPTEE
jgi:stage V sporulation protein D (sporulation-specific penicillin-binding protein)